MVGINPRFVRITALAPQPRNEDGLDVERLIKAEGVIAHSPYLFFGAFGHFSLVSNGTQTRHRSQRNDSMVPIFGGLRAAGGF